MRVDRFLARRFPDRSRTFMVAAIRRGEVRTPDGRVLRASSILRHAGVLHVYIPGIAPTTPPPPHPEILHEDERVVAILKPPGLAAHPGGTNWSWGVIGLAKAQWPEHHMDLVHRLDRDTSGVLLLTKDQGANGFLKAELREGRTAKHYLAIAKGVADFTHRSVEAPIGRAGGEIRMEMGIVPDGLPARTDVEVLGHHRSANLTLVRCRIHTGRTHQIRVHMASLGLPLLGDRLYGVPARTFLSWLDDGPTEANLKSSGAGRHALHAERMEIAHPDGGTLQVEAPMPQDMASWWDTPHQTLPWTGLRHRHDS